MEKKLSEEIQGEIERVGSTGGAIFKRTWVSWIAAEAKHMEIELARAQADAHELHELEAQIVLLSTFDGDEGGTCLERMQKAITRLEEKGVK